MTLESKYKTTSLMLLRILSKSHMRMVLRSQETTRTQDAYLIFGKTEFPLADLTDYMLPESNANLISEET